VGITARHNLHHFARAILEGVAFSIRDCLSVVEGLGQPLRKLYLIGGGAKSATWRRVLADVLGRPLNKPAVEDAAFGSALLAGVAVGLFPDLAAAARTCAQVETIIEPDPANRRLYDEAFAIYRDVVRDLTAHSHRLAKL
jgi:xylulokinase